MDLISQDPLVIGGHSSGAIYAPKPYDPGERKEEDKPPRIRVDVLQDEARKLKINLVSFKNKVLAGPVMFDLAVTLCKMKGKPATAHRNMVSSLSAFHGLTATDRILWRIAFRVNGNIDSITSTTYLDTWKAPKVPEWAPVHVINVEKAPTHDPTKKYVRLFVLVLDGPAAGVVLTQRIPVTYVRYLLREIGLPKRKPLSEWEVYNTMFTAQIGLTDRAQTAMLRFHVNTAQKKRNKAYHEQRNDCPRKMLQFCDRCPFGLDQCPLAVKRESWKMMDCTSGHKAYFKQRRDG